MLPKASDPPLARERGRGTNSYLHPGRQKPLICHCMKVLKRIIERRVRNIVKIDSMYAV